MSNKRKLPRSIAVLGSPKVLCLAALFAAIEVARCDEASGKTVVAICPDGIDRYLSTDLFE